jgi:osmotically-inducible protein OsmY
MMRIRSLALIAALALAGCNQAPTNAQAPKPVPLKPVVEPLAAAKPAEAPAPTADEQLASRVKAALRDTRAVDGQGVGVGVAGGVVTLYGTASAPEESRKIAKFVAGIEGVQSVVNNLVIVRGS